MARGLVSQNANGDLRPVPGAAGEPAGGAVGNAGVLPRVQQRQRRPAEGTRSVRGAAMNQTSELEALRRRRGPPAMTPGGVRAVGPRLVGDLAGRLGGLAAGAVPPGGAAGGGRA